MAITANAGTGFTLQELDGFPYNDWVALQSTYTTLDSWYKGEPLNATVVDKSSGKAVDKYPIKINPLKSTARKHAMTVFGQNVDSIRFGGLPIQLIPDLEEDKKEIAEQIKKALMDTLSENNCGAMFFSNCILSQYLGGSILAAKWLPVEGRIEITNPSPREFIGVPKGMDYWHLREGWIVKEITVFEAQSLGYKLTDYEKAFYFPSYGPRPSSETTYKFYYIEYWDEGTYKIQVNNQVLKFPGTDQEMAGSHQWGRVPIVYIPHLREEGFVGEPIISEAVKGIIRELNLRWADIGDAVSEDSHSFVAVRNIRGTVKVITVDGRPVVDLGANPGISSNETNPDMMAIKTQSASEPMLKFGQDLYDAYRREVNHPAVADGEDEGSQRSSLTLTTRMWPLVAEAEWERLFWTTGLMEFSKILLTMMSVKKLHGITADMIKTPLIVQWMSMLPRDRESLIQEIGVRAANQVGSRKHLMGLMGDVQNPDEEFEVILEEEKKIGEAQPQQQFGNSFGNSTGDKKKSSGATTNPGNSAD